jgi:formylglycine-generating enzyme required for sulfatase activity
VRSALRPLIIDWSGQDIALLEGQSKGGLVVVRYDASTRQMELLTTCRADGRYDYVAITRQDEQIAVHDADELRAQLPLGAARLEGQLAQSGQLLIKTTIVGLYRAAQTVTRAELRGDDCGRATHVVRGISVGAFRLVAGADARSGAGATVAMMGASARHRSDQETDSMGGREEACASATPSDPSPPGGCGSPLRLEMTEIGDRPSARAECARPAVWDGSACVRPPTGAPTPATTTTASATTTATTTATPTRSGTLAATVRVPGGTFRMGDGDGDPFDGPVHEVSVEPFEIDRTEVTVAAYATCVAAGRCTPPMSTLSPACNYGRSGRENHPVNCIRWEQAQEYCEFVGARLPTEPEWEYAARGPEGRPFPWGAQAPGQRLCWARGETRAGTCDVGAYPGGVSPFGLLDMAGNVAEWTASPACAYQGGRCQDAHVYRGGSWFASDPADVRASARGYRGPVPRDDIGVRCARDSDATTHDTNATAAAAAQGR